MQLPRKFFLLLSVALVLIGGCGGSAPSGPEVVTKAEAERVKVGMTLEEARKIVGHPGEAPPVHESAEKIAVAPSPHVWMNPDGSGLTVIVHHGKIQQVSPLGLK